MTYEELLIEANKNRLIAKEKDLMANKGLIKSDRIAIKRDIPTLTEKSCVLAEELGHYYTTVSNILDQSTPENRTQELKLICGRTISNLVYLPSVMPMKTNAKHCMIWRNI